MNTIIYINKEKGFTSRDVVNIISKKLNTKKVGHMGTLDPIAEGVLIIGVEKYTKFSNYLLNLDKEYIVEGVFGFSTDTYDITGNKLNFSDKVVRKEELESILKKFVGLIIQKPPIYSAIKIKGKKLYQYARNNEEVVIPNREVNIYSLDLLSFEKNVFKLRCKVSKGTYIRSLVHDIGLSLNTYACMQSLVRTKQGKVDIVDCGTIDDLKYGNILDIIDIDTYTLINYDFIKHGQKIELDLDFEKVLFIDEHSNPLAIYNKVDGIFKMEKNFL